MIKIPVVNNSSNALPEYSNPTDAGFDMRANIVDVNEKYTWNCILSYGEDNLINRVIICPGGRALIPTGLHMAIPEGYELQVRARSGLALKKGITMVNGIGTIDSPYRGDIGAIIINHGFEPFTIEQGDRICQGVLNKVEHVEFEEVESLDETERGKGGYGHSGVK